MTMSLAEFVGQSANVQQVGFKTGLPHNMNHPKGWEPGVVWTGGGGVGISKPRPYDGREVDHAGLLKEWGFDPSLYAIEGALEYRQWDAATAMGQETFRYYKAKIVPRVAEEFASLPALIEQVRKHKKSTRVPPTGEGAFCVFLSDWQLGKGEGDGSEGTLGRLLRMIDGVEDRIRELRKIGRSLGELYVFGLGDIVEGCTGFYQNQEATIDLFGEEQRELAVHVLIAALKRWSALFEKVVVAAVIGNHGTNRKEKGGTFTDDVRDNTDTGVFKTAALVLRENPDRYGHVSFYLPKERSTLCMDVAGVPVGVVHGHQFRGGGKLSQGKAIEWWKGQSLGLQPVAHAMILVSAHFHHYSCIEHGPRTHFQTPAMDPGSRWVNEGMGTESPSGTLTFVVADGGWGDQQIIR